MTLRTLLPVKMHWCGLVHAGSSSTGIKKFTPRFRNVDSWDTIILNPPSIYPSVIYIHSFRYCRILHFTICLAAIFHPLIILSPALLVLFLCG
ncbi:hypothetical protein PILCRDRAFT_634533 [Piloderma croceum F 1598]|uniref:Uncharacterized protein n=1 Tax=Piloderma croceum (strain F 1598) TaxID=765440 RepID=A0A0C3EWJ1_PILCF|nr:hypothetical protein PILCRDRAFT_634533 [Piloderma croceum F 1598]